MPSYKDAKGNRAVQMEIERVTDYALSSGRPEIGGRRIRDTYQEKEQSKYSSPPRYSPPEKVREQIRYNPEEQVREEPEDQFSNEAYTKNFPKRWEQPSNVEKEEWSYEKSMEKFLRANPTSSAVSSSSSRQRVVEDYPSSRYEQKTRGIEGYKPTLRGNVGTEVSTKSYHYKKG